MNRIHTFLIVCCLLLSADGLSGQQWQFSGTADSGYAEAADPEILYKYVKDRLINKDYARALDAAWIIPLRFPDFSRRTNFRALLPYLILMAGDPKAAMDYLHGLPDLPEHFIREYKIFIYRRTGQVKAMKAMYEKYPERYLTDYVSALLYTGDRKTLNKLLRKHPDREMAEKMRQWLQSSSELPEAESEWAERPTVSRMGDRQFQVFTISAIIQLVYAVQVNAVFGYAALGSTVLLPLLQRIQGIDPDRAEALFKRQTELWEAFETAYPSVFEKNLKNLIFSY